MKKIILLTLMAIVLVSGCTNRYTPPPNPIDINDTNMSDNQTNNDVLEFIFLDKEGTIKQEDCVARRVNDKVIILESKYCSACRIAVPILKEIEEELQKEFIFLDLSQANDMEKLNEFRVMPHYTPTILIGCDIHIGVKSKEIYKRAIEEFLGGA